MQRSTKISMSGRLLRPGWGGVLLAILVAIPGVGSAQDSTDDAATYQIELLIFRHNDASRTTPEVQRDVPPDLNALLDERLALLDAEPAAPTFSDRNTTSSVESEAAWQPVAASNFRLNAAADRLRRLSAYDVIDHLAWTEVASEITAAPEIALRELGLDESRAHGTVKFYKKRYPHLSLNVHLGASPPQQPVAFSAFRDAPVAQPTISDSRRVRPGKLTYFDQPEFGVIALVTSTASAQ